MFHIIKPLLASEEVAALRDLASRINFIDGKSTNVDFSAKNNLQASPQDAASAEASRMVQAALVRNQWVREACQPRALAAPLLTKYAPGMSYGEHVDTHLVMGNPPVRVDVSCTVFLNDPENYDGGELVVRLADKTLKVKEPAGNAVLYPSTSFHHVAPVTRGERLVAITFIESFVRDPGKRIVLYELQDFIHNHGAGLSHEAIMQLEFVKMNLLRMWHGD